MTARMHHQAAGFTLISALFVLVVVSALGVYLSALSTTSHASTALAVRASQAMYAAQSGIEWVVYRLGAGDTCATLPATPVLDGFTITVDACNTQMVTEGTDSYPMHDVSVTAGIGSFGDPTYVTRRLSAVVAGG
ncbi:MAG: hypothetical protein KDJ39_08880 [Gammaproteobacteria bacterium]|nr:hypothetical protein [Gammaproteobacteria bacterium]